MFQAICDRRFNDGPIGGTWLFDFPALLCGEMTNKNIRQDCCSSSVKAPCQHRRNRGGSLQGAPIVSVDGRPKTEPWTKGKFVWTREFHLGCGNEQKAVSTNTRVP